MKILVIDDNEKNRKAAVAMLTEHEVVIVASYDEAMDLILGRVNNYDVLRALGRPTDRGICIDDEFRAKVAELMPKFDFDLAFVDLMMPASDQTLGYVCEHPRGAPMPYGFPLMINIAMRHAKQVKNIAIVSDVNHHEHAMSAALDSLGGYSGDPVEINGVHCWFIHAHLKQDGSKNWNYALKRVVSPKEGMTAV